MIIGLVVKRVKIPKSALVKHFVKYYNFFPVNLDNPVLNVATSFARSQGYDPTEGTIATWQHIIQHMEPEYRIKYMNHILPLLSSKRIDTIIESIDSSDELSELKRNGGKVILITECNCLPKSADHVIRTGDIVSIYNNIDEIMDQYIPKL